MSLGCNDVNVNKLAQISHNIPQSPTCFMIKQSIQPPKFLGKKHRASTGTRPGSGAARPPSSLPPWDVAAPRDWECADGVSPATSWGPGDRLKRLVISINGLV